MESNTSQKLWHGSGLKFLNKFSDSGFKVVFGYMPGSLFVDCALYPLCRQVCKTE